MKELNVDNRVYLEEYDVNVVRVLPLEAIEMITRGIVNGEDQSYMARVINEEMLLLFHGTDIGQEEIEKHPYTEFKTSGLIDAVKGCIVNYAQLKESVAYAESLQRALVTVFKEIDLNNIDAVFAKAGLIDGRKK